MYFSPLYVYNINIDIMLITVQIDTGIHFEHGKVIRCDIKPGLVERSGDVENGVISEGIPLGALF
jgi:hypothetical protein